MAIKGARADLGHVTPHLIVRGGDRAIDFYRRAFGATLLYRAELPHGAGIHAHLRLWHTIIMVTDEAAATPADDQPWTPRAPESLGNTPVMLETFVEYVDDAFDRAIDAGATEVQAPTNMFFGDRAAYVRDPFGHVWGLLTKLEELTAEEIDEKMRAMIGSGGQEPPTP